MDTQTHDNVLPITEILDPQSVVPVAPARAPLPPLSQEEDSFCMAIVEFGGNIAASYRAAFDPGEKYPTTRGKKLLARPEIAMRIKELEEAVEEITLISASAHLSELARIRDIAIATGQAKVAYQAERSRGEVVGLYARHEKAKGPATAVQINVNMASKHDENI